MRRQSQVQYGARKTDIGFFVPTLAAGGAERITINLAAALSDRGYAIDIVLVSRAGPYVDQVPSSVRLVDLGARRTASCLLALKQYVEESSTTTVVSALHHGNLALLLAKRLLRLPARAVITIHNTYSVEREHPRRLKNRFRNAFIGTLYPWADEIVAVSNDVADDFAAATGLSRERITTVYNPVISTELFRKADEAPSMPLIEHDKDPLVLGIGRLTRQKDFATLVKAFSVVRKKRRARLVILGEGEDRPELESLAARHGLGDAVLLPGFVANPYSYLRKAAVFVLSSRWEGLPTVLIEALALGVPIVSTDCRSGPREILAGGKYGELVPVGDSEAMAAAILRKLEQPLAPADASSWVAYTENAAAEGYLKAAGVAAR